MVFPKGTRKKKTPGCPVRVLAVFIRGGARVSKIVNEANLAAEQEYIDRPGDVESREKHDRLFTELSGLASLAKTLCFNLPAF